MKTRICVVLTTVPGAPARRGRARGAAPSSHARRVADAVLRTRLAACVSQIQRVRSRYWWEGKIEESVETLLVIKTRAALFPALERAIRKAHPHSVPEIIRLPVSAGHGPYLDWILRATKRPGTLPGDAHTDRGRP
ncbi:MAG: divalent-cation tolerance protein CutA [Elusimicrobia bacterium]|nr:divalent-cation tolerance protein CutA [Elusimicrobiota bacterium]